MTLFRLDLFETLITVVAMRVLSIGLNFLFWMVVTGMMGSGKLGPKADPTRPPDQMAPFPDRGDRPPFK